MAKLQKKLAEAKKRRQQRPRPVARDVGAIGVAAMRRMSEDHPDVLQGIEFALVEAFRRDDDVDDVVVLSAMRAFILGDEPSEEAARNIWAVLHNVRNSRTDISNELWCDALRVVMDSVRRHSSLRPGSIEYLAFVSNFIP